MFELYNLVLRAYGNSPKGVTPQYSTVYPGYHVEGRFTTTLHVLNSAVLKLSRLQPALTVYRGISRMKLPKVFIEKNDRNVRGGVEYGFMSTTSDKEVALTFAKSADAKSASTLVVAEMGMVDRGATLDWLSQYPHEAEILMPPLTAMEVKDISDFQETEGFQIRQVDVRLNCNMMSQTVEKLLTIRKKQVSELCTIIRKDIVKHDDAPDIPTRTQELHQVSRDVEETDGRRFNDNKYFLDVSHRVQQLMPQLGDQIQLLVRHSREVFGLVHIDSANGVFASSSCDGTAYMWEMDDKLSFRCKEVLRLPAASTALACVGPRRVASGQFDGYVALQTFNDSSANECVLTGDDYSSVTAVAALVQDGENDDTTLTIPRDVDVQQDEDAADGDSPDIEEEMSTGSIMKAFSELDSIDSSPPPPAPPDTAPLHKIRTRATSASMSQAPGPATTESKVVDLGGGLKLVTPTRDSVLAGPVTASSSVVVDPGRATNASHLASGAKDGCIMLWDLKGGTKLVQTVGGPKEAPYSEGGHTDTVRALLWTTVDGQPALVSGSFDQTIIVWKLSPNTGLLEKHKHLTDNSCEHCCNAGTAHKGAVSVLAASGSVLRTAAVQPLVASGSADGAVKMWNVATGDLIRTVSKYSRGVCSLAWMHHPERHDGAAAAAAAAGFATDSSPTGWLACGLGDNSISIANLESPDEENEVAKLTGHEGAVHALLWLHEKGWLVSGSADATVRTWRIRSETK
eukprot:COSAG01_NODE_51_length_31472_cov_106.607083_4_plen_742_part_00